MRSPCSESFGSRRPSWAVMYPLQSAKCHEPDRKPKAGSAEGRDGRSHRVATSNRGNRADRWSGARGYSGPSLLPRVFRTAVACKHPRMGVLDLESRGRQGHHMGSMVWQMTVGGQVDGDVALVA